MPRKTTIRLKNLKFFAHHGVLPEETRLGQRFEIDLEYQLQSLPSSMDDQIGNTVSYAEVYDTIERIATTQTFKLLESLADALLEAIKSQFRVSSIIVRIRKPSVPISGILDTVEVEQEWEADVDQ